MFFVFLLRKTNIFFFFNLFSKNDLRRKSDGIVSNGRKPNIYCLIFHPISVLVFLLNSVFSSGLNRKFLCGIICNLLVQTLTHTYRPVAISEINFIWYNEGLIIVIFIIFFSPEVNRSKIDVFSSKSLLTWSLWWDFF